MLWPGVYWLAGPPLTLHAHHLAATLARGPRAVLVPIGRWEADLLWPAERVVVEVDGFAGHSGRLAFERDRRKDGELRTRGYEVVRFTYRQITREPEWVVATLAALLARRSP